jgi:hypothetical protein
MFMFLITATRAFPATQKSIYQIPMPLLLPPTVFSPTIEVTSSGPIVYIPLLDVLQTTAKIYQVDMSTTNGVLLNSASYFLSLFSSSPVVSLADS